MTVLAYSAGSDSLVCAIGDNRIVRRIGFDRASPRERQFRTVVLLRLDGERRGRINGLPRHRSDTADSQRDDRDDIDHNTDDPKATYDYTGERERLMRRSFLGVASYGFVGDIRLV